MISRAAFTVEEDVQRMRDEIFLLRLDHAILVEGKSDEPFWEQLWDKVVPGRYKIYAYVHFPTADTSGKAALVNYYLPYGSRDLLFCLDSDYDYLLERPFLFQPFVFQTFVYSIENFQCYTPALLDVFRIGVQDEAADFDFEHFFQQYSRLVYYWLSCQLYQHQTIGLPIGHPPSFNNFITNVEQDLAVLSREIRAEEAFTSLQLVPSFRDFLQRLSALGLTEQNAYLFVRGHDLLERVVLKLIKCVAQPIIAQEFARRTPEESAVYHQYRKQNTFEGLLRSHHRFEECDFYIRLFSDATATLR